MPDTLSTDWHLHSRNSCDCKNGSIPTTMAETFAQVRAAGVTDWGVTDHLHTPYNLPDIAASRAEFNSLAPSPRVHFGIEVSCVSAWEIEEIAKGGHDAPVYGLRHGGPPNGALAIGVTADELAALGVEYVIGGTHWPMYVPYEREAIIRDYHRQNMFLACHPLVKIVAHPWWWMGHWMDADGSYRSDPWFDDMAKIPQSMHDEFAAAAREHNTIVEINLGAVLLNRHYPANFRRQYCEYLAGLKAAGVVLSLGADHHSQFSEYPPGAPGASIAERSQARYDVTQAMLNAVGIRLSELWCLPPREA